MPRLLIICNFCWTFYFIIMEYIAFWRLVLTHQSSFQTHTLVQRSMKKLLSPNAKFIPNIYTCIQGLRVNESCPFIMQCSVYNSGIFLNLTTKLTEHKNSASLKKLLMPKHNEVFNYTANLFFSLHLLWNRSLP